MKIYIAGKITGDPNYKEKFNSAEKTVAELGHSVMNPAWLVDYPDFTYADYVAVSTTMQFRCNAILMLKDWGESNGAICEFERAKKLGQEIFFDIDKIPRVR